MPGRARNAPGGLVYHALNRAVARLPLFQKDRDDQAFERVLDEALREQTIRLLGYCLMPNHWHMVLWPEKDDESTGFLRWLTHTHSMRWHAHYHTGGTGHIYQGRFKSFPVATIAGLERVPGANVEAAISGAQGHMARKEFGPAKDLLQDAAPPLYEKKASWVQTETALPDQKVVKLVARQLAGVCVH